VDIENKLKSMIREVFSKNRMEGFNKKAGKHYFYHCPSRKYYPFQWLWDSAFHAIINLYINPEHSLMEIKTLLSTQFNDGLIPHMAYWIKPPLLNILDRILLRYYRDPYRSRITQPPVIAYAVKKIKDLLGEECVRDLIPPLEKYFEYLSVNRDFYCENLPNIIHSWESGLDNLPVYDPINKMFRIVRAYSKVDWNLEMIKKLDLFTVRDTLFISIYAEGLKILYELTGKKIWKERYKATINSLIELTWDDKKKIFVMLYSLRKRLPEVKTVEIFAPLILDIPKDIVESLINEHLLNKKEFWLNYPIPTVAADEKTFNPHVKRRLAYWRGPIWISTNWIVFRGLIKHGYKDIAREIAEKSIELVLKNGLREYYDPIKGTGGGASDFGWSGLVIDMLFELKKI